MAILEAINKNLQYSYREIYQPELLEYAKNNLSKQGVLNNKDQTSYFYLAIEDDYILKLFPMIKEDNIILPDYFSPHINVGAHISVIYPNEIKKSVVLQEVGQAFQFDVIGFFTLEVFHKKFYVVTVVSPSLEKLRAKYNLSSGLNYRGLLVPFHITIAIGFTE